LPLPHAQKLFFSARQGLNETEPLPGHVCKFSLDFPEPLFQPVGRNVPSPPINPRLMTGPLQGSSPSFTHLAISFLLATPPVGDLFLLPPPKTDVHPPVKENYKRILFILSFLVVRSLFFFFLLAGVGDPFCLLWGADSYLLDTRPRRFLSSWVASLTNLQIANFVLRVGTISHQGDWSMGDAGATVFGKRGLMKGPLSPFKLVCVYMEEFPLSGVSGSQL